MGKIALKIINWIKENKKEALILGVILLVGAFLRLYRISDYMTFLSDEGRDVIVVRRLLVYADPILVGPGTSIGNMYLGPLYYYLMAPVLFLANYSPVGPAVQIALLGVGTIFFVWYVGKSWFGKIAGIVAASLYAISPTVIVYSRSSWNPNIMPFFSLLTIWGLWKVWRERKWNWLPVIGISFAAALQSHYLGLLLAPTILTFWILTWIRVRKGGAAKTFIKKSVLSVVLFLLLMSPLVIFDARHGWLNFNSMKKFFVERQTTVSARPWNAIPKFPLIAENFTTSLLGARHESAGKFAFYALIFGAIALFINRKKVDKKAKDAIKVIAAWILFALIGLGLYKQSIFDHYYGFFFAAPFIFLGGVVENLLKIDKKMVAVPIFAGIILLTLANLSNNPFKSSPNRQLERSRQVAENIAEETGGERFNFAVIAFTNSELGYKYFMELNGAPVVDIDPSRGKETITEQLFVICEKPKEACDPLTNPKTEISNFGWKKIENEWEVFGVRVYKLVHP